MLSAIYVVVSLIILEGLLSFDNALVLAAMVQPLPAHRQKLALRIGLGGAYLMRGLSIFFVAYLIQNPWLKPVGAAWLLYLMCSNLGNKGGDDEDDAVAAKPTSFFWTVVGLELADMAFSIDNIFAAAAFSSNIYAVLLGVALGILAMRFVAGLFVSLIKKFPVLEKIGYVLVGYIGLTLAAEFFFGWHITETVKFAGVIGIMAMGILYERVPLLNRAFSPIFTASGYVMGWIAMPIDYAIGKVKDVYSAVPVPARWVALAVAIIGGASVWCYFYGFPVDMEAVRIGIRNWADDTGGAITSFFSSAYSQL
jgi:tellurite resistance protein TerC